MARSMVSVYRKEEQPFKHTLENFKERVEDVISLVLKKL